MVAQSPPPGLMGRYLPAIAVLVGIGVAAGIATAPAETLNGALDRSGIAGVIPAAGSPIGATGRTIIALLVGTLVAAAGFAGRWRSLLHDRALRARPATGTQRVEPMPVVRRADAHPDAPPRRPIRASADFGDPLPIAALPAPAPTRVEVPAPEATPLPWIEPTVEASAETSPRIVDAEPVVQDAGPAQTLPADLDQPMSTFDPAAVPDAPLEPVRPVVPLVRAVRPFDDGERIETFELTPMQRNAAAPEKPGGEQSIAALLARLEAVAARRAAEQAAQAAQPPRPLPVEEGTPEPAPAPIAPADLHETLHKLRRLAAR